ncbi:hypothetical protein ACFY3N_17115 [Streptomyces sp. NPDC000348]|uniref:hypothetical protein n=1 Tax=Streptomyces sp. NPDC000348 TaxID=3364538 RepID=UPI00367D256D
MLTARSSTASPPQRPCPIERALPLLRELAGPSAWNPAPLLRLHRTTAVAWRPDTPGGDRKVFPLLQEAYRITKLLTSTPRHR